MQKIIKLFKNNLFLLLIVVLSIPTFSRMLKPGIYSMQDFHFFRLVEFDKCIKDFQIPCRWAPDAGLGYGEPLFNFYGQGPYLMAEVFRLFRFSLIDSLKIVFILSLVGSGISMFLLSKKLWDNNWAALVSSIIYLYAPYRAVDVWVRGALPEALSFVLFPLIILELEIWLEKKLLRNLLLFSFFLSFLIITHNLSVVMFLVFLLPWLIYKIFNSENRAKIIKKLSLSVSLSLLLSSFYILPVLFESKFINLAAATTEGYFNFRGHFVTLSQLLFSRFWGYGASVFGVEDGLNLSVGIVQWTSPLLALIIILINRDRQNAKKLLLLIGIGWFALFLSHNKSTVIWESFKPLSFLQFPWRFLSIAVFSFALASGAIIAKTKKLNIFTGLLMITLSFGLTVSYFREDIWYKYKDADILSGNTWKIQTTASIKDYWPKFGTMIPTDHTDKSLLDGILLKNKSSLIKYSILLDSDKNIIFPVTYFPGWHLRINNKDIIIKPSDNYGLISAKIPAGRNVVNLSFEDTPIRLVGNFLTLASFISVLYLFINKRVFQEKK